MGMTMAEKILARAAGKPSVKPGDYVDCKLDGVVAMQGFVETHGHAISAGLPDGLPRIFDPEKLIMMIEHHQPATSLKIAERAVLLRKLAARYEIKNFYDSTCGIAHQMMVDHKHALPGQLVIGCDSHTIMLGGANCASAGIGETELAYAATFGELWFRVPQSLRIRMVGKLPGWLCGKDIMLHLAGRYGADFALYQSIEFAGETASAMSMDSRFTMADHGIEVGAKFALFECDDKTRALLHQPDAAAFAPVFPDRDAVYSETITVDVSEMPPQVAAPHSFDNNLPIEDVAGVKIHQATIGSCANGRFEDIAIAADILKGRKVASGTRLLVSPASWGVYKLCVVAGLPQILLEAGAQLLNPGCGVCTKGAYLAPGETCITATTRNYQGRMGSPEAEIYLASPATVAWSAVRGQIADPREAMNGGSYQ
jgi:3-isopropylmalate/(R)-2-methylmalate dehydratase large subunit